MYLGSTFIQSLCRKLSDEYVLLGGDGSSARAAEECRDLEAVLRGDKGVQTAMNWRIQDWDKRQTMQWEACLSKYIRFQRGSNVITATNKMQSKETRDLTDNNNVEDKYFYYVRPQVQDNLAPIDYSSTIKDLFLILILLLVMLMGYFKQTTSYN